MRKESHNEEEEGKKITEKKQMWSPEKDGDKERRHGGEVTGRLSLPPTQRHNSNSSVKCPAQPIHTNTDAHTHTHIHTHTQELSFTRGEGVPRGQINHPSQLGVRDTGRVNLIREKIRP